MKPAAFEYVRPESLDEALAVLAQHGDDAKVLAGGQSLVPLLSMRMARPAVVLDINRVLSLDNTSRENGVAHVGALVRQTAFAGCSRLGDRCLPFVGHFATRNRGTVCGSIAHADASAELPLALVATGGSVIVASASGTREVSAEDFFVTHFTTVLTPAELVVATRWPDRGNGDGYGCGFAELALRAGDYALAMAAAVLRVRDGAAEEARVVVGAVVDRPTPLSEVAVLVDGRAITADVAREAGALAGAVVDPPDSLHASGRYRRRLTELMVERALLGAWRDVAGGPA